MVGCAALILDESQPSAYSINTEADAMDASAIIEVHGCAKRLEGSGDTLSTVVGFQRG